MIASDRLIKFPHRDARHKQSVLNRTAFFGLRSRLVVITACGLLAGCVTVPQYDAATDTSLSSLQSEIDAKLVEMVSDVRSTDPSVKGKATYQQNVSFYNKVDTDIESLELRMEAVPDASNKNLPEIFNTIRGILDNFENTQKQLDAKTSPEFFGPGDILATRNQLNADFAPLITYELMLKGVSSPKPSSTSSTATSTASAKAKPAAQ